MLGSDKRSILTDSESIRLSTRPGSKQLKQSDSAIREVQKQFQEMRRSKNLHHMHSYQVVSANKDLDRQQQSHTAHVSATRGKKKHKDSEDVSCQIMDITVSRPGPLSSVSNTV